MQQIRIRGAPEPLVDPPLPPDALRGRVHGDKDPESFRRVGEIVSANVLGALGTRATLSADSRVLDFGCGCGRVISHFRRATGSRMYGTDVDAEAVAWCRDNLSGLAEFCDNGPSPPLPFGDGFFDFVYGISIFTHLPRQMEMDWLAELCRVTKPGGYLVLTTHGWDLIPSDPGAAAAHRWWWRWFRDHLSYRAATQYARRTAFWRDRRLRRTGFLYLPFGTAGLPGFYGVSFHTDAYIERQWGRLFDIEAIIHRGLNTHQELVLCRRR